MGTRSFTGRYKKGIRTENRIEKVNILKVQFVTIGYNIRARVIIALSKEDMVRKEGYVVFTFRFEKEDGRWTAYCDELGTATFGRSLPEAERKLNDAILLHINTLEEVGERERFLSEHNIELHPTKPKDDIQVCLPISSNSYVHPHVQSIPAGAA